MQTALDAKFTGFSVIVFLGFIPSSLAQSSNADILPSYQSDLSQYIDETGAAVIDRQFETHYEGTLGVSRPVVNVSADSFATFARHFQTDNILYLFHDPYQHVLVGAYNGHRGTFGRFQDPFEFTASGAMLIPILLTRNEVVRLQQYLELATNVPRHIDVASFPWLLQSDSGESYGPVGDINSFSEWFARMPIGTQLDEDSLRPEYSVNSFSDAVRTLIRSVWSAPRPYQSLRQKLGLQPFRDNRDIDTPGLTASAILANTSIDRVPAVFRYMNDHREVLPPDFNNWFDVDYQPNQKTTKESP